MPSRLSTEYWKVPVTGTVNGTSIDVSADPVYIAVTTDVTQPGTGDWHAADWESLGGGKYAARILIGPNGGILDFSTATSETRLYVWVKVTDNPETPVINAGPILIT